MPRRYRVPSEVGLAKGAKGDSVVLLQEFLHKFGYLQLVPGGEPPARRVGARQRDPYARMRARLRPPMARRGDLDDATATALGTYQMVHGLPQSETLDRATVANMNLPRCGFPDPPPGGSPFTAQGNKWHKSDLTFLVHNGAPGLSDADSHNAIGLAFGLWSQVCPLTFSPVGSDADISLSFVSGDHFDGQPFDGLGNVAAHGFFPPFPGFDIPGDVSGDVHFDADEAWSLDGSTVADLLAVAVHEIGHALGLDHSADSGAIMHPIVSGAQRSLGDDDVAGIQFIYGSV